MVTKNRPQKNDFFSLLWFLSDIIHPVGTKFFILGRNFSFWDEILEQIAHFKKNSNFAAPKMTRKWTGKFPPIYWKYQPTSKFLHLSRFSPSFSYASITPLPSSNSSHKAFRSRESFSTPLSSSLRQRCCSWEAAAWCALYTAKKLSLSLLIWYGWWQKRICYG